MDMALADPEATSPSTTHRDLRLWLRLLTLTGLVEAEVRSGLRRAFDTTLPRFDFLAALHKADGPLTMGELSRRLMVSNGNSTGLAERLAEEGLIERNRPAGDKRTQYVSLTPAGKAAFETMAIRHEQWIEAAFADLSDVEVATLMDLLGKAKASVRRNMPRPPEGKMP